MIKSFSDSRTEQIFSGQRIKGLDQDLQKKALRRLRYIDTATSLDDLRVPPSNKLEKKEGTLKGYYGIWVNKQWRIIFRCVEGDAHDVQLVDKH